MTGHARPIKMFGMDVDGVLTDGGIYYGDSGMEMKRFHVQDGMGITLLRRAGVIPFVITARRSAATARRTGDLGIREVHQGIKNKLACIEVVMKAHGADWAEVAFVGDDLSDLEVFQKVGLPIAVANAVEEVRCVAKFITSRSGGDGAVREACEHVLKLNGYHDSLRALLKAEE
jgi:3-deoxy-D-manno-octulosonate 8-phosphate phosphatase (KDO 8-P phosphatase)